MLGFIVLGAVMVVTLVFALAAYLIDRGEERLEESEGADRGLESIGGRDVRSGSRNVRRRALIPVVNEGEWMKVATQL